MKNILMTTLASAVLFSAAPAFATEFKYMGMGIDMEAAGNTTESRMAYHNSMPDENKAYFKGVCLIPFKNRSPAEQAYCNDITANP